MWMPDTDKAMNARLFSSAQVARAAVHGSPQAFLDREGSSEVPSVVHEALTSAGRPIEINTRRFMESRFGHSFSQVQVHTDSKARESARAINAQAYTLGSDIVFASTAASRNRRLMAHELAHVLQQTQVAGLPSRSRSHDLAPKARLFANDATSSGRAEVGFREHDHWIQRQAASQPQTRRPSPPPVQPNQQQQGIIDTARRAAAIRSQIAMFRVTGIVPPSPAGRTSAAAQWQMRATSLARTMFNWRNPNLTQIGNIISTMVTHLASGVQIMIAGSNDPECGTRVGYVRGFRPPIVLCPQFFGTAATAEQQTRTMIHEAAHLASVGRSSLSESYCVYFDCQTSCGGFNSADSWAHFVHCLSGQAADRPQPILGTPPPRNQTQPQPRSGGAGGRRP